MTKRMKGRSTKKSLALLLIFGMVNLLAIGVGWAVLALKSDLLTVSFSAFSSGTFLYVGATHIINDSLSSHKSVRERTQ